MCSMLEILHIRKNTQKEHFCQTTNSDELALGMRRWLEVHFLEKYFFAKLCRKTMIEYIIDFPNSDGQKKRQNRDSKKILNLKKVICKHIYQPIRKYLDNYRHVLF